MMSYKRKLFPLELAPMTAMRIFLNGLYISTIIIYAYSLADVAVESLA